MLNTKSVIDINGFVRCPLCGGKTRQKARNDTYLKNFPLFCPKCKCNSLIGIEGGKVIVQSIEPRID